MTAPETLELAVTAWLDEHCPYWRLYKDKIPPGLRLELHPAALNVLWQDPEADADLMQAAWTRPDKGHRALLSEKYQVPVIISRDLPHGHFRLVEVTEDVKIQGKLTDIPEASES